MDSSASEPNPTAISEIKDDVSFRIFIENWRLSTFGLVDSRLIEDFSDCHVYGSTNVPNDDLSCRAGELPPRSSTVCLLSGSEAECKAVLLYLESHDYKVALAAYASKEVFNLPLEFLVRNCSSSAIIWEPSPVLKGVIETVENLRLESGMAAGGVAIDLACGSGRDCVFLAHRGWKSIGYDYLEDSLERAKALAARYGTSIETVCADLEADTSGIDPDKPILDSTSLTLSPTLLDGLHADLVNVSRYLHRPLLPSIADMINPGGFIVYHQFMVGCTKPRRARFLLQEGELARIFSDRGFDILEDKVFPISDGRPCCWFLARKRM